MASLSAPEAPVFTVDKNTLPPFFAPVNRGAPLTAIDKVKQFADSLLSFGNSVHFLAPSDQNSFKYIKRSCGEELYHLALKASMLFALIAIPLARILHAFWTKRPISASLALPLAVPAGLLLAKLGFRSDLTSVPSTGFKEEGKNLRIYKAGRFDSDLKLLEGLRYEYEKSQVEEIQGGKFDSTDKLEQGFFISNRYGGVLVYFVNPLLWFLEEKGLNFSVAFSSIYAIEQDKDDLHHYLPLDLKPLDALFEIARDSSCKSPIQICVEKGKFVEGENPFEASKVIDFLIEAPVSLPRFWQIRVDNLREFIELVREHGNDVQALRVIEFLIANGDEHYPRFWTFKDPNLSEFVTLAAKHAKSLSVDQLNNFLDFCEIDPNAASTRTLRDRRDELLKQG